jgi:hypothetical protein
MKAIYLANRQRAWTYIKITAAKLDGALLPRPGMFFFAAKTIAVISTIWLISIGKSEIVPSLWVSIVAATLSYFACFFSAEKVRLDLFDRRFAIYKDTLEFCSSVHSLGSFQVNDNNREEVQNAMRAAYDSFRGLGYHKSRALFGKDIWFQFDQLNKSFSYIKTYGNDRVTLTPEQMTKLHEHEMKVSSLCDALPELFRPYMYFGDYSMKSAFAS